MRYLSRLFNCFFSAKITLKHLHRSLEPEERKEERRKGKRKKEEGRKKRQN
jgi:hypothetical protein